MSRFEAVRARWESHSYLPSRTAYKRQDGADSPSIPLLHLNSSQTSLKMVTSNTSHTSNRRLTNGFGMLGKPLNAMKSKALSRGSRQTSSEYSHATANEHFPRLGKNGQPQLMRSQTTSFLPVPKKSAPTTSLAPSLPPLPSNSSLLAGSRIPTPTRGSRPSYLPRSTAHPNLSTTSGRRASDHGKRNSVTRWPLIEDSKPLPRSPLVESPMLETPTNKPWFGKKTKVLGEHRLSHISHNSDTASIVVPLTSKAQICQEDKENGSCQATAATPDLSPRAIQHHHLLQPILPDTPPVRSLPSMFSASLLQEPITVMSNPTQEMPKSRYHALWQSERNLEQRSNSAPNSPRSRSTTSMIMEPQTNAYWSGRFSSLSDRLLNEDSAQLRGTSHEDSLRSRQWDLERAKKAFEILEQACVTDDARQSLLLFRNMYAIQTRMPNLRTPIPRPVRQASGPREGTGTRRVSGVPQFMRRSSGAVGPPQDARFSSKGIPAIFNHPIARELRKSSGGGNGKDHDGNDDLTIGFASVDTGHTSGGSWAGFKERLFHRKSSGKSTHSLVEAVGGQG